MLRDFVRTHVFEHFPAVFGCSMGAALVILFAWAAAIVAGPESVRLAAIFGWCTVAGGVGAIAVPLLTRLSRHHAWASVAEPRVFAIGFSLVTVAAMVVACGALLLLGALLLAVLGLPSSAGIALIEGGTIVGAAIAAAALAWGFATHGGGVEVTHTRIELEDLPDAVAGLRIAHLSDIHIGNGMGGAKLAAIVDRTNAVGADLVVITGDLFDNDAEVVDEGAAALARLEARLGVYAVLGNHDGFVGAEEVARALAEHAPGITLLRGDSVRVATPAPFHVAGFDDPGHDWKPGEATPELDALAGARATDGPTLLLMHRPDPFPRAAALGFTLVLSGHFHGGQVALPIAGGSWNAARVLTRFDRGLYREARAALYVSRGLGFAGPRLRFASAPEIAVHELWPVRGAPARPVEARTG